MSPRGVDSLASSLIAREGRPLAGAGDLGRNNMFGHKWYPDLPVPGSLEHSEQFRALSQFSSSGNAASE